MTDNLKLILNYLDEKRGVDFSGYHQPMLERLIRGRLTDLACNDLSDYLSRLQENHAELDRLLVALTINVSRFFRDTLTFELIGGKILPAVIREKIRLKDHSLRVWSAGCARGEEAYSLAILAHELLDREGLFMDCHFFATDIDVHALKAAEQALYPEASVVNVKHRLLKNYFIQEKEFFRLIPDIKKRVTFIQYDMLDKKHGVPPESVFGNFDLVLCRNLLIYFNADYQEIVFGRLHNALARNGYLVLGDAEAPVIKFKSRFSRVFDFSPVYRKR